jgi:hypothetical protein
MKKLTVKTENKLKVKVKSIINNSDYDSIENYINDLFNSGCQSGMVGELIYYADTLKFYKKYKVEIQALLKDLLDDCGLKSPVELFGDKWDQDDIFATDTLNQNLLAWFGFEETARILADRAGLDI